MTYPTPVLGSSLEVCCAGNSCRDFGLFTNFSKGVK